MFGGPRTGKTGYLAGRVIDAPGAVLVTSTRTDLHELAAGLRAPGLEIKLTVLFTVYGATPGNPGVHRR